MASKSLCTTCPESCRDCGSKNFSTQFAVEPIKINTKHINQIDLHPTNR